VPSPQHAGGEPAARVDATTALSAAAVPAVEAMGLDIESLEVRSAGRGHVVKIVVDSDDGVTLDVVAEVSRSVSAALDARDDLFSGPYTLEVTSPGADRPLTKPRHWRRARSRLVRVRQQDGTEFAGRVGPADDHGVVLLVDGTLRRIGYGQVAAAAVEVEFRPPPAADLRLLEQAGETADRAAHAQKEEPT